MYEHYLCDTCTHSGRPFNTFIVDLQNKGKTCKFGMLYDTLIRDCNVCGIDLNTVRKCLLCNANLSLEDAIATVHAAESSKTQHEKMNIPEWQTDTHKKNLMKGEPCCRCGTVHKKRNVLLMEKHTTSVMAKIILPKCALLNCQQL